MCAQLLSATIVAPVGKSDPALDIQTEIIFCGKGGAKINKFLDYIESKVIGRNLSSNTPYDNIHFRSNK